MNGWIEGEAYPSANTKHTNVFAVPLSNHIHIIWIRSSAWRTETNESCGSSFASSL